jgi:alanyl-tRNA synthetase
VVDIVGFSTELCGGTHVRSTAEVGPFKILSESSVGQGVRRIEAVTSGAALALLRERERASVELARDLKTEPERLPEAVSKLRDRVRELEKSKGAGAADGGVDLAAMVSQAEKHDGIAVLALSQGDTPPDDLLDLSDRLRGALGPSVVVLASSAGGRAHLVASATPEAVDKGGDAAAVIREISPLVGGGGGGRPTMARAGGKDPSHIDEALAAARSFLASRLG